MKFQRSNSDSKSQRNSARAVSGKYKNQAANRSSRNNGITYLQGESLQDVGHVWNKDFKPTWQIEKEEKARLAYQKKKAGKPINSEVINNDNEQCIQKRDSPVTDWKEAVSVFETKFKKPFTIPFHYPLRTFSTTTLMINLSL